MHYYEKKMMCIRLFASKSTLFLLLSHELFEVFSFLHIGGNQKPGCVSQPGCWQQSACFFQVCLWEGVLESQEKVWAPGDMVPSHGWKDTSLSCTGCKSEQPIAAWESCQSDVHSAFMPIEYLTCVAEGGFRDPGALSYLLCLSVLLHLVIMNSLIFHSFFSHQAT